MDKYQRFIESRLTIIGKDGVKQQFKLNAVQQAFINKMTNKTIVLKARQQGFSSLILAMFASDFLLFENTNSVVVADKSDNAMALLDRVKYYIKSYEDSTNTKVPLKYNSKYQLVNAANNSTYHIGTAQEQDFGRSRTLTNLHLSEAAFYPNLPNLLAGAAQAVVPSGKLIIETTANGFNEFKTLWEESKLGNTAYTPLFFKGSDFYDADFLEQKRKELGDRLFMQEYPESDVHAFLTSGDKYFSDSAIEYYLSNAKEPLNKEIAYV